MMTWSTHCINFGKRVVSSSRRCFHGTPPVRGLDQRAFACDEFRIVKPGNPCCDPDPVVIGNVYDKFNHGAKVPAEPFVHWREHRNLSEWMCKLWVYKGLPDVRPKEIVQEERDAPPDLLKQAMMKGLAGITKPIPDFDDMPLELKERDLNMLEAEIKLGTFLYNSKRGDGMYTTDEEYKKDQKPTDQEFIKKARKALKDGKKVCYHQEESLAL